MARRSPPSAARRAQAAAAGPWVLITRTDGWFVNQFATASGQTRSVPVTAQLAGPLSLGGGGWRVYLPIVARNYGPPDLIVQQLFVTRNSITVVIKNQGNGPVVDEFWVDVYINPNPVPTHVNQVWWHLGGQGLVWGIKQPALPLQPGATMTLTIGDAHYDPAQSDFSGTLPVGTPVYAQVDAVNTQTSYGGVLEGHEMTGGAYNNIVGPVYPQ